MLEKELSLVRSLGELSRLLNDTHDREKSMNEALAIVGRITGARTVSIHRKHYTDQDNFSLECLYVWTSSGHDTEKIRMELEELKTQNISVSYWNHLERQKVVYVDVKEDVSGSRSSSLLLGPIFLGSFLFGFLAIEGLEKVDGEGFLNNLVEAVCRIFELYVARSNVEKRLDDIFEFIPNPTSVMRADGQIVVWNPAIEELSGSKASDIIEKDKYTHAIPFYREPRPAVLDLILEPDVDWEATYPEFRREGESIFVLAYCPNLPGGGAFVRGKTSKIYDVNGRCWGAIHSVRDVTKERQMEKNLRRSEIISRTVSDFSGVGIAFFQREKISYFNERFAEMLGILDREISIDDLFEKVHPDDRETLSRSFEEIFQGAQNSIKFELRVVDGERLFYWRSYAQVVVYDDQQTIHFIIEDVSEQKELARQAHIHQLKMYHEDRLSTLGIMAAGIAHELNQPLNIIRVVTDGLLFGRDEGWSFDQDELYDNLSMISEEVVRMSKIIENTRNFARADNSQEGWGVDINEAVSNVFSMIWCQLEDHGIEVHKGLAENLSLAHGSLNLWEQVIMNLIVNARQALDHCKKDKKQLWVKTGMMKDQLFVEVMDNAIGISEDYMKKIFEPFFTTKKPGEGTGLGLSISQTIMDDFNGKIEVFNNYQGGATFRIICPLLGEDR
jgi:PAS domain S-box-containing protein